MTLEVAGYEHTIGCMCHVNQPNELLDKLERPATCMYISIAHGV